MLRVFVTGMSGTGKSSALRRLGRLGHRVVDTDTDEWSRWVTQPDGSADWVWREDAMAELLTGHSSGKLFVSGCKTNQGAFYRWFEHVVLLSAPAEVLLARIAGRTTNPYGKTDEERALVLSHLAHVEPLLRAGATAEIDASAPLDEVVRRLDALQARPVPPEARRRSSSV
ncbi:AAA family ATPase [Streptomyces sp. NPDC049881]|uniref:AAA family ATPase n=1 Tax=Streptomyces sp. NPDC049881 TaxID=3155778 RepID=UPI0034219CC4